MTQRRIDIVVGPDGKVVWHEGSFDFTPHVAPSDFAGFPPHTLVEVTGEYRRIDARSRVLRVSSPPVVIATPVQRALKGYRDAELVATLADVIAESPEGCAVLAYQAHAQGNATLAREHLYAALRGRVTSDEAARVIGPMWRHAGPIDDPLVQQRLVEMVWVDSFRPFWFQWIDPFAHDISADHVQPRHFGGPRAAADYGVLAHWVDAQFLALATPGERLEIDALRAKTSEVRRARVSQAEDNDELAEEEANKRAIEHHEKYGDPMDSPPDSNGRSPEDDEAASLVIRWASFIDDEDIARHGRSLRELARSRKGIEGERAMALAGDAAVLLSGLAPHLVLEIDEVVVVDATTSRGRAIVRLLGSDRFVRLDAPNGYFGAWSLRVGTWAEVGEGGEPMRGAPARGVVLPAPPTARALRPTPEAGPVPPPEPPRPPRERFVFHDKFGSGKVLETISSGDDQKLVIEFSEGKKTLLARFVQDVRLPEDLDG